VSTKGYLRDIEFQFAECYILQIEYTPKILVKWGLKSTSQDLRNLYFSVYRGESPSELERISGDPIPANTLYEYIDATPKLKMISKNYYYKIVAEEIIANNIVQKFESVAFTWQGKVDYVAQYIIDEHNFAYEHVHGVPTFLFKRKKEGARCDECWDKVLKRVTKSNCHTCLGTGFIKGYYNLIPLWMDFNPDPALAQIPEFGVREPSNTDIQMTNYPILQFGDIILELEPFRFWRVVNTRNTEKNRTTILQVVRLDEVNKSDIEQHLQVDQNLRAQMLAKLEERQNKPEF
jgi:hypothetical protein